MGNFITWVLSILAIVIVGTILDMFLSEKKLGKTVRAVFASLTILVIISPIPSFFNSCNGFESNFNSSEIILDQKYLQYANRQKTEALENGLIQALKNEGYSEIQAEITAEFSSEISINLVKLDLSKLVIEKGIANINKVEKIKSLTADFLQISKTIIIIYE